jgi:acyl-CoA thioesterase FadM
MDFIRLESMFRSSLYENTVEKGMLAILVSQKVIYKKPLRIWSTFSVKLILEEWDEKWAYHHHIFIQDGKVCAVGLSKLAFRKHKRYRICERY